MSVLTTIPIFDIYSDLSTISNSPSLVPVSNRNGLTVLKGSEVTPTVLPADTNVQVTTSVRQGKPFNPINNTARVKRKFVMKVRVPVSVPGLVAGAAGTVIDYVDVDLTIAAPVEAGDGAIATAHRLVSDGEYAIVTTWVRDMILEGNEPF